jgi:molybdopterin-synthase adenylyltransferase
MLQASSPSVDVQHGAESGMRRPRVKAALAPILVSGHRIRFNRCLDGLTTQIQDDKNETIWRLMQLLDGSRSTTEAAAELARFDPGLDVSSIFAAVESLHNQGYLEDAAAPRPEWLSASEIERYSRNNEYLAILDHTPEATPYALQRRLKSATVNILGLGGVGSSIAASLVACGVGRIRCYDFDVVERSNLNRQLLYCEGDIGRPKVEAAVERLKQLNPDVDVSGERLQVREVGDVEPIARECDVLVDVIDTPDDVVYYVNDAASNTSTPWLMAGYTGPRMTVAMFFPGETPCIRCAMHEYEDLRVSLEGESKNYLYGAFKPNSTISATANLSGQFGALEVVYHLTGLGARTRGRIFHQSLWFYDRTQMLELKPWAECPACRRT